MRNVFSESQNKVTFFTKIQIFFSNILISVESCVWIITTQIFNIKKEC